MRVKVCTVDRRPTVALYHAKAREMRIVAEQLVDPSAKHQLMMLALGYELLAEHLNTPDEPEQSHEYWLSQRSPDAADG